MRLFYVPFLFVAIIICVSCSNKSLDKANDLIKTGAFDQAVSLLDKEIQNDPKNDKAYLVMANCLASKYADIMIKGIKEEGLFGDALAPAKEALKRKTIDYYNGALQLKPANPDVQYNLLDFYLFSARMDRQRKADDGLQTRIAEFKKSFKVDDSNVGKVMFLADDTWEKYLKGYFNKLSTNEKVELVPQEGSGTIMISADCEGLLREEGESDKKIGLKMYDVFKKATPKGDKVEFHYDTIDKTGPIEYLYRASIWKWTNYTTGWKEEPTEEYAKCRGKLFKTLLTNRDAGALAELQDGDGAICNLKTLFEGSYGNHSDSALKQYPQYRIREQLPFSPENEYRNIENIGEPMEYKINRLGFYMKQGKVFMNVANCKKWETFV